MIRLIGRTLIIPRGDTGSFSIPTLGAVVEGDIAVFSIYDPLYQKTVHEQIIPATIDMLNIVLLHEDTVDIEPSDRYQWDIKIYHDPQYNEEGILVNGSLIDSYFAAYSTHLPKCIIKPIAQDIYYTSRQRTRDRLAAYESLYAQNNVMPSLYPFENVSLTILSNQLYQLAKKGGYNGNSEDFYRYFGFYLEQNKQEIIFAKMEEFPETGSDSKLYFNTDEGTLYRWVNNEYQPVNAMLIANTIIEGGGA